MVSMNFRVKPLNFMRLRMQQHEAFIRPPEPRTSETRYSTSLFTVHGNNASGAHFRSLLVAMKQQTLCLHQTNGFQSDMMVVLVEPPSSNHMLVTPSIRYANWVILHVRRWIGMFGIVFISVHQWTQFFRLVQLQLELELVCGRRNSVNLGMSIGLDTSPCVTIYQSHLCTPFRSFVFDQTVHFLSGLKVHPARKNHRHKLSR